MSEEKVLEEFLAANPEAQPSRATLQLLLDFLKSKGQFVFGGDLKKQFIEQEIVKDKNGIPIIVHACMICENKTYEIQSAESAE